MEGEARTFEALLPVSVAPVSSRSSRWDAPPSPPCPYTGILSAIAEVQGSTLHRYQLRRFVVLPCRSFSVRWSRKRVLVRWRWEVLISGSTPKPPPPPPPPECFLPRNRNTLPKRSPDPSPHPCSTHPGARPQGPADRSPARVPPPLGQGRTEGSANHDQDRRSF